MNSSRTCLPSGLRRVVDNPDTQMLSRARAPSTLKRSSLGLDLYLWTTPAGPLRSSGRYGSPGRTCPGAHLSKENP